MDIRNKVFVVTGAGNGIGREVALQILKEGGSVAGVDLSSEGLAETSILAQGSEHFTQHPVNIADREAVSALPAEVIAAHGKVDGLVNVAGVIQKFVPVLELEFKDMEKVMNVNFWGVMNLVKAFLPELLKRPKASIVNVSSMGALAPVPGQSVYGASKAAVDLLTQGLYAELIDTNIAVTGIFPGAIATNITENSGVEMGDRTAAPGAQERAMQMTSAADAATVILEAIRKEKFRATIGKDARALDVLSRVSPQKATEMIAKKMADLVS